MSELDDQLSKTIIGQLVGRKVMRTETADKIAPKLARGDLSASEWNRLMREELAHEERTNASPKA